MDTTTTHTVSVSFGRNVGDTPMPERDWATFRSSVAALVPVQYGSFTSDAGKWNGNAEESALILGTVNSQELAFLRTRLAELAAEYRQDGIGLLVQNDTDTVIEAAVTR